MSTIYLSELKRVINNHTGKIRYYVLICGAWMRFSFKDYENRVVEAYRQDTFYTINKKHLSHHFKTVYYRY